MTSGSGFLGFLEGHLEFYPDLRARFTLRCAWLIDTVGAQGAATEISAIKVAAARLATRGATTSTDSGGCACGVPLLGVNGVCIVAHGRSTPYAIQNAISRAVLVLLLPPVSFMTIGAGMAVRYSKKRDEEQSGDK